VKAWLGHSAALGSSVMRVFAGGQVEGAPRATAEDYVRDGLAECAKVAADCGVILALENHGGLTGDADGILALVEPFADNPWVGINLDFGNFAENNYEQYQRCLPHTVTTHCKVTHRLGGEKERVDYRRVVRLLRDGGYDGYLSIEYEEPEDPIAGVSRFAAYLRGCIVDA
jgi:sugar phosphate isomerase/epimerase